MQVDSLSKGAIITNNSGYMKISRMNFQDIDDITDWNLAELKYQLLERK
jgi:CMP-N-acetylneuraminic acid synthetase